MAEQDNTLRDDLEAAVSEVETEEEVTTDEVQETAAPEATQETETEVSGEAGAESVIPDEPTVEAAPEATAPIDWPAEVKEQWANLPPDVQAAVAARERHINETLEHTAGVRHAYDSFNQMIAPFEPLMVAENITDPMEAIHGLLTTTAQLAVGSPQQKAERIASLIAHYSVDIGMLDSMLAGEAPNPAVSQFEQMLNQRLAPVDDLVRRAQQAEANHNQQTQAEAGQSIQSFASNPDNIFFNEVRNTMADFLDMAAQQGHNMSLEEAYQRACLADPDVAPRYTSRMQGQAPDLSGKANAASSVSGNPAGGSAGGDLSDLSLRDTIAAQFGGNDRI